LEPRNWKEAIIRNKSKEEYTLPTQPWKHLMENPPKVGSKSTRKVRTKKNKA